MAESFSDIMGTLNKYLINSKDSVSDSTRLNQLEAERKRLHNEYNATSDEAKKVDIADKLDKVNESIFNTQEAINTKQERASSIMNTLQGSKAPDKSSAYLNAQAELNNKAAGEEQIQKEQNLAIANQDYRQEADKNELSQSANMQMQARNALGAEAGEGAGALAAKDKIATPDYNTMMQRSDTRRDVAEQNMQNEYAERQIGLQNRADAAAKDFQAGQMNSYNRTAYQLSTDSNPGAGEQTQETPSAQEDRPATETQRQSPAAIQQTTKSKPTGGRTAIEDKVDLDKLMTFVGQTARGNSNQLSAYGMLNKKVSNNPAFSGRVETDKLYVKNGDKGFAKLTDVQNAAGYSDPWVRKSDGHVFVSDSEGNDIETYTSDGQAISDGNLKNIVKGLYRRF